MYRLPILDRTKNCVELASHCISINPIRFSVIFSAETNVDDPPVRLMPVPIMLTSPRFPRNNMVETLSIAGLLLDQVSSSRVTIPGVNNERIRCN